MGVYLYIRVMMKRDPYVAITYWNPILDKFTRPVTSTTYKTIVDDLMVHQDLIRQEYLDYVGRHIPYPVGSLNKYENQLAGDDGKWKMVPVKLLNSWVPCQKDELPITRHLLKKYENSISSAFFSILEPGKVIPFHEGPYKGILRLHIPVITPYSHRFKPFEEPPLALFGRDPVDNTDKLFTWDTPFIFDDSFQHKAWNLTDETRVILLIELRKPISNWFIDKANRHLVTLATAYADGLSLND